MQTAEGALMAWWFDGLGGLGGWWFFALLAFLSVAYVWLDSQSKRQPAVEWKLGVLFPALFLIPTVYYWFSPPATKTGLLGSLELIFLLGLIGGIMPLGVAIAYWIAGPVSVPVSPAPPPGPSGGYGRVERDEEDTAPGPRGGRGRRPVGPKPKARGWLIGHDSRQYPLYKGQTAIGRARDNDLVFADPTVSKEHCLIREENDVFTLYDRAATYGTFLNDKRLTTPEILHNGDVISVGETRLKFVSEREV